MVQEGLCLLVSLGNSIFLLHLAVLATLSAAEKNSPDEDNEVSDNHSD